MFIEGRANTGFLDFLKKNSETMYSAEQQFEAMKSAAKTQTEPIAVVLDMDETLTNTVKYWVRLINRYLKVVKNIPESKLPTYEQVCKLGGTDKVYPTFFMSDETDEKGKQQYHQVMENLRHRTLPNLSPELMEAEVVTVINELVTAENSIGFIGYLTARPGKDRVMSASQQQMQVYQLPQLAMVGRPALSEKFSLKDTSKWKVEHLEEIITESGKPVVIIDDSLSLVPEIIARNQQRGDKPLMIQVLYPGPLTHKDGVDKYRNQRNNGIYISNGWKDMATTLDEVRQDINIK